MEQDDLNSETALDQDRIADYVAMLRGEAAAGSERYHAMHELGRGNVIAAKDDIAAYLESPDPSLRRVALEVLTHHFWLDTYWETARKFLEQDVDELCRCMGASSIATLRQNSQDRTSLALLASVVMNELEDPLVRKVAYRAMRAVVHYDPWEQIGITSGRFQFETDVDWTFVRSYLADA